MSRVFVIQNQQKMGTDGQLQSKFDLSSAKKYGDLVFLLSPTARPFSSEHVIGVLNEKLADFNDSDFLLLIGNPCLIGFAVAVASRVNHGRVKVLQWNGTSREYIRVDAILEPGGERQVA